MASKHHSHCTRSTTNTGVFSCLVGYPLDMIKVRLQTSSSSSMMQIVTSIVRKDGVLGLYRGVWAPLVGIQPIASSGYWGFVTGKRLVRWITGKGDKDPLTFVQLCLASSISGVAASVFMTPTDRVKVVMQAQAGAMEKNKMNKSSPGTPASRGSSGSGTAGGTTKTSPKGTVLYKSSFDCMVRLVREGGIQSLYKGWNATLLRDVPGFMVYYVTFDVSKTALIRMQGLDAYDQDAPLSPFAVMLAGGMGGTLCWAVIIPLDTIKSRIQTAPEGVYPTITGVYRDLMKDNVGVATLYRGFRPALFRAFPANAAFFLGTEIAQRTLSFLDR